MGKNINQIATSAGSVQAADKLYLGRSPYGVTDDRYLLGSSLLAQVVVAPSTTTDNGVARYNGTTGQIQNSGVIIDDSNNVSGVALITAASGAFSSALTSQAGTSGSYYPLIKNLGFDATLTSVTTSPAIVANYSFPANFFTTPGQYLTYDVYLNASSTAGSDTFTLALSFVVGMGVAFSTTSVIPITLSTSPQVVRLTLKVIIVAGNVVKFDFNVYSATTPNVGAPNYIQDIADSGSFAPSQTCQVLLAVSGSATCTVQYIHSSIVGT